jgi:hypothetical protein
VREVCTAWITTSTTGPPRFCTISVIDDTGPISRGPTSATAHNGRMTAIDPIPKPPTTMGPKRSGKYGISRVSVEPKSIAPTTNNPEPMSSQRGATCGASLAATMLPTPNASANGTKQMPAFSAE